MTTYIMSRTREGLDAPDAVRGPQIFELPRLITDMTSPTWEGMCQPGTNELDPRGYVAPQPGHEGRGMISAWIPGTSTRQAANTKHLVWVRAQRDVLNDLADLRDRYKAASAEQKDLAAQRDELIKRAADEGLLVGAIAEAAGISSQRVSQISPRQK